MKYEIKWKEVRPECGPIFYRGKVGHWAICTIHRSHTCSRWYLGMDLPGINSNGMNNQPYESVEIAKAQANKLFKYWIDRLGD